MFTAADVKVLYRGGHTVTRQISFGGGDSRDYDALLHAMLVTYAAGNLCTIKSVNKVHDLLVSSGYGINNAIVLEVGPLYLVDAPLNYDHGPA